MENSYNSNIKKKDSNSFSTQPNQIKTKKTNAGNNVNNMNSFEAKKNNNFFGVFGVHPGNAKYTKKPQKEKEKKKIDCKTPDKIYKKDLKIKDNININSRKCKTPIKSSDFSFITNKNQKKKENLYKGIFGVEENNKKVQNKDNNINKNNKENNKDNKIIEKDKNAKKENTPTEAVNKKTFLKRATKIYELKFYEPFNENITLLDGEGKTYEAEFQRKDFEIKISFNKNIFFSFNDIIFTSDYFCFPQYFINKVRYNPDSKHTTIILKDYRSFKIQTKDDSFFKKLNFNPIGRLDFIKYSHQFSASQTHNKVNYQINGWKLYNTLKEFERQGVPFGMESFRLSQININYKLCETYPSLLILPSHCDDSSLAKIASCRTKKRFPALTYVYTHPKKGYLKDENTYQTFLYRSSQINTGFIFNKKDNYEIAYINAISSIGHNNGFIFYDCRPYFNAKANTLKGAGIDDTTQYDNCQGLLFGCIENIHAVRKAFKKAVEKVNCGNSTIINAKLASNPNIPNNNAKKFLSKFEESKWLEYLSDILCGSNVIVNYLLSKINVICHCSDGWDRTSQLCSIVQIILDPYFRTFEGFAVLIEKDWVSFGHQFAIRNGCDHRSEKKKERSPIFVQFLHAIYQIMEQYPDAFEFRENMLLFLSEEIYSNKYGTFLFNSEKELEENEARQITVSIWSEIFLNKKKYINPHYRYIKEPLAIKGEVQYLVIWKEFFYKYINIGLVKEDGKNEMNCIKHLEYLLFKEKNSIIELMNIIKRNGLENEMINNDFYKIYKEYLDS